MLDRLKDEGIELYFDPGIGEIPKQSAPFTESKPLLTLDVMPFDGTLSPPLNGSSAPLPGGILPMPIIPLAPPTLVQPVEK